ncbi:helicase C-terminal domain-containing protein [Melissococcus sp. OM08-11BH]|uniref:helicase C-terminal domain-containing protein n=1 Tax=Melissococcus sp. OM08-11BH TaxID=2293110 RepID=UPI000E4AAFD1|nr:helicase C-terminal domain-containing protein [Melissococcus sp. OM08-11BH]RGI28683.1 hypothetical protein DXC12_09150 [Melissococcus sp. OM08-11BH]
MEASSLFAVVDIETTGTNQEMDKIIQFACVIVENQKIVNQMSIDINPLRSIPKHITELTGISNKDVANEPYFEDVAYTIRQLLDGCVFVAHNVFFDFNFLNSELVRAGIEPLKSPCLDTVEIFQVLYPTSNGFRVSDMASEMALDHANPHQALSDAYVTAQGFIKMIDKLRGLPEMTLEKLTQLSKELGVNNHDLFQMILDETRKKESKKENHLMMIDGLVLKKKNYDYRYNVRCTNETFGSALDVLRANQKEMSEDIYQFLAKESQEKDFFIEAETGTGKTMGYLYPLSFVNSSKQVLISTSTIMLQNQIVYQDIPLLNKLTGMSKYGVVVKSASHYISLESFKQTLDNPVPQKTYAICQMAVLVWLLETTTGDLDEVNVSKNNIFYQHVQHTGKMELLDSSLFYEEDFFNYLNDRCRFADFIIVNHAFLFADSQKKEPFLPEFELVVVDEAHQLPALIENLSTKKLSFSQFGYELNHLIELSSDLSKFNVLWERQGLMIGNISQELRESLDWLEECFFNYYRLHQVREEVMVELLTFLQQVPMVKRSIQQIKVLLRELSHLKKDILEKSQVGSTLIEKDFFNTLNRVIEISEWFNQFFYDYDDDFVKWAYRKKSHLVLSMVNFENLSIQQYNWYHQAKKIIYTSGSLQLDNESSFLENKLGLNNVAKKTLPTIFDYKNQARLYLIKGINYPNLSSTKEFSKQIYKVVKKLYNTHEQTMLVLFTSHNLLEKTYQYLIDYFNQGEVLILAQGISGTKEKILKKINQGNKCIILGANSFWEGMDFSKQSIDIVVMTKLPFEPPNRPIVQARYHYLEQQGVNPFYEDAIPQAGIKLRQGVGRLLRSPTDKGILVLLDDRLINSRYSNILCSYLPKELDILPVTLPELVDNSKQFLKNKS